MVNIPKNPKTTWNRLWNILIDYIDHDLEGADVSWVKETLQEICTEEELKELGIWEWLGYEEEEE